MLKYGLLAHLRQWPETWVQVQQASQAWSHGYGWIMVLGLVGLATVVLLGVRGWLSRARAFPHTETEYPQWLTAWNSPTIVRGTAGKDTAIGRCPSLSR